MSEKKHSNNKPVAKLLSELRDRAESQLCINQTNIPGTLYSAFITPSSPEEMVKTIHELSVQQIELEMQQVELIQTSDELLQTNNQLQKSEERFRRMFEDHSAIMLVIEPFTGKIIDANQAAVVFYGWHKEVLCRRQIQHITDLPFDKMTGSIEEVIGSNQESVEFRHKRSDGSVRDVELFSSTVEIDGNKLIYAIINDITGRKSIERERIESRIRFNHALESANAGVWEWDLITNENIWSDELWALYGMERNNNQPSFNLWAETIHPDDREKTIQAVSIAAGNETELHAEYRVFHPDGTVHWLMSQGKPIFDDNRHAIRYIGTIIDITDRKLAEIQLESMVDELKEAKEKAEENDRLKTAFLANISHEIRTPMNGILGFAELLKEPHLSGEELAEYIDLIQQSGKRMMNLISDILDISRLDAKETTVKITETPLNKLLLDLQTQFRLEAQKKGLRLTCCNGLADSESLIQTDAQKLSQILANLIQNAIKFTSTGGIDFGYTKKENMLEFYCVDSGIGIPANKHKKIFDRFHQLNNSLTRNHEGSGLGLSISKSFVELLGGTINVQSIEGAGTTFTVTLPHNPVTSDQLPTALLHAHCPQTTACCILIVEDDEVSTILLNKILQSETLTLLYAVNGWEAVELVRHHPEINLVLMDIKMPGMNGYEATKEIKKFRPDLPVIAQTAFASKEEQQKGEVAGCDAFITKPINKTDLLNLIQSLLNY